MATKIKKADTGYVAVFDSARCRIMCAEFSAFRIDPMIQMLDQGQEKGRILGFIRGLRLSAHLIYEIRETLEGSGLKADWGHIIDEHTHLCSPECDIIIYAGPSRRWNGSDKPVMDFHFVEASHAVAVISCKSYLKTVDQTYPSLLQPYIKNVWLFAECCPKGKESALRQAARKAGYRGFYYLYPWDGSSAIEPDLKMWREFVQALKKLRPRKKVSK